MSKVNKDERPVVSVNAQTANTVGITIKTVSGDIFIVASHTKIIVNAHGADVEVQP